MEKDVSKEEAQEKLVSDVKTVLADAQKSVKEAIEDGQKNFVDLKATIDEVQNEIKKYDGASGELQAKLEAIAEAQATDQETIQKQTDVIDRMLKKIDTPQFSGSKKEHDSDEEYRLRKDLLHIKRMGISDPKDAAKVTIKSVSDEDVAAYSRAGEALEYMMNQNARVDNAVAEQKMRSSDPELHKALMLIKNSTDDASSFWITESVSSRTINCSDLLYDYSNMFSSESMTTNSRVFPTDNGSFPEARFSCETDCRPNNQDVDLPGETRIEAHEMLLSFCVTHKMLEDASRNVMSYYDSKANDAFIQRANKSFFQGTGAGEFNGLLNQLSVLKMGAGSQSKITRGHLIDLWSGCPDRFRDKEDASYFGSRSAFTEIIQMVNANNDPALCTSCNIMSMDGDGLRIMNKPFKIVNFMPSHIAPDGTNSAGAKPIGYGSLKDAYMIVNRMGTAILRNPYSMPNCGVEWIYRKRQGGDVLCSNAAILLETVN